MEALEKQNLVNRISNIYPDHTMWIKEQFGKKKFMYTSGRIVFIDVPGRNLKRQIEIPSKEDPSYKNAWINVYNHCLDYLEGSINVACLENKFIQRMGNSWTLNGHTIFWPKYNPKTADYARGLEKILDEYMYVKKKYIELHSKRSKGLVVRKTEVKLDTPRPTRENRASRREKNYIKNLDIKYQNLSTSEKDKPLKTDEISVNKEDKFLKVNDISSNKEKHVKLEEVIDNKVKIHKISDGDILNGKDIRKLKDTSDMVLITCMNVLNPKEEDIFLENSSKCSEANLSTGAFIYGVSTDEKEAVQELKRLFNMLNNMRSEFDDFIVYSVNNEYIIKNRDSDIKLLNFINMYNSIMQLFKKMGYTPFLSMNLSSKKIIDDINRRYNMQNENDIIYVAVVRDLEQVSRDTSVIVVDPWNDFDLVNVKNKEILDKISEKKVKAKQ